MANPSEAGLTGEPAGREPLDAVALAGRVPGWQLRTVAETGSTNADLLAAASRSEPHRTVLVADLQTTGRGRLARSWQSPRRAGLTLSVLLRLSPPAANRGWLPLLAGVALARAIGPEAALKWPNDVLLGPDQRKVAGILSEATADVVVIGLGVNVSTTRQELPVPTATSLAIEAMPADRAELLVRLLAELDRQLERWSAADGDATACGLAQEYRQRCATLGRPVTVDLPERRLHGRATGIDDQGRLVVAVDGGGGPVVVAAGDVTHVRSVTG